MTEPTKEDVEKGKKLLSAVERIVASNDTIREMVAVAQAKAKQKEAARKPDTLRELTAAELVRTYSNRAAIAGGAAGLPALIPGVGSIAAAVAGTFAELAYLLKCEVEMTLALTHLYGFDIEEPKERQLAFLMASVGTYDASGGNFFADVVRAEGVAIWNYGPRRLGRLVLVAMTSLALMYVWRGFLKAIPFLGMAIGSTVNKVLTQRVGERVATDLRTRVDLDGGPGAGKKAAPKKKAPRKKAPKKRPPLKVVGMG